MKKCLLLVFIIILSASLHAGVADLFIKKMSVTPQSPTVLDSTRLFFVIQNQGTARCEATQARIQIKRKNGIVIMERMVNVFALDPDKTFTGSLVLDKVTTPGSYSFELQVNVGNVPGESNYNNNLGGVPVTVHGIPDLIVCYRPYYTRITVRTRMYALVKNIGSKRSEPCKLRFGLTSKGRKLFDIPALDPGKYFRVSRRERWRTKGTRRLVLKVDPDNKVKELNESNNSGETQVRVYILKPKYHATGYTCSDGSKIID